MSYKSIMDMTYNTQACDTGQPILDIQYLSEQVFIIFRTAFSFLRDMCENFKLNFHTTIPL